MKTVFYAKLLEAKFQSIIGVAPLPDLLLARKQRLREMTICDTFVSYGQ